MMCKSRVLRCDSVSEAFSSWHSALYASNCDRKLSVDGTIQALEYDERARGKGNALSRLFR